MQPPELDLIPHEILRSLLIGRGYQLLERRDVWCECLLCAEGESFLGRGSSPEEALRNAVRRALPTRVALALLAAEIARAAAARGETAPLEPPVSTSARAEREDAGELQHESLAAGAAGAAGRFDEIDEGVAAGAREGGAIEPALAGEALAAVEADARGTLAEAVAADETAAGEAHARPGPAPPTMAEVISAVEDLSRLVESEAIEVAGWNAERQRLQILAWISEARDWQEASGGEERVTWRVGGLASRLSQLSREWWPGSVRALQRMATPSDCTLDLASDGGPPPWTWGETGERAARLLAELEQRESQRKADDAGWMDAGALEPAHAEPDSLLGDVRRSLEEITGPLDEKPEESFLALSLARSASFEELRLCARRLRWLRGSVQDVRGWARAVGRLRFVASCRRCPRRLSIELDSILDPSTVPSRPWALELDYHPERKEHRRARVEVLRGAPKPGGELRSEELQSWLRRALDTDLEPERVAALLKGHEDPVKLLQATGFSDVRRQRKRLRRLQALLSDGGALPDRDEVLREAGEEPEETVPPPPPRAREPDPLERMRIAVLPRTRGKRALLVTNRADPEQDRALEEALELGELEHFELTDHRAGTLASRVASRTYDLVLCATGFLSHKAERPIKDAARLAGVPYVRANRARRAGCIRAVYRDLGLDVPA